ncbi:unnamed protein product [Ascophyllum nodosum]
MGVAIMTFLRSLIFWLCLCAGRGFVMLPTARLPGRELPTSRSWVPRNKLRSASTAVSSPRITAASRWARMSTTDQEVSTGGGTGTGVQTIVKERVKELTVPQEKEKLAKEQWWRVILHNDEIHTFDYVTQSITKVVKKLTMKKAYEVTMETHKAGKATVTQAWKSKAEGYCMQLQQCGLTASIAPDSKFEGGESGDGGE